ncbi:hypothetical protein RO3G_06313 [Lichtheimia corymbifera JMRC:FSU:9682]|uniref:Major facilitator superfamily (MFS) profile domain-containing protein n=1 Tax=Lichtheimia corymbifera JMRC:FSU:9682 TaxID=1263082 RepID=A0A068RI25_9FUNG|nr:hypothetical protein RO3G_06313 [Lichtheimia corymbifera JMRC:FSU:9682]
MYSNEVAVSFIGSTAVSILQLGILTTPLIRWIGVRYTMLLGALVSTVSLILASFATELWQLFATQGFMYGIGLCLVFNTPSTLSSQWFVKNRALANGKFFKHKLVLLVIIFSFKGIAWSGATMGPIVYANCFQASLSAFGRQITLTIMAGVVFIMLLMSAILSRPRYPVIRSSKSKPLNKITKDDKVSSKHECLQDSSLLSIRFLLILLLSFNSPFHWQTILFLAPSYAQYVGASPTMAAFVITVIFVLATISRIGLGFIADRCGRLNVLTPASHDAHCLYINVAATALLIMTLWRYADTVPVFAVFCGSFGLLGGLFPNMRPVIISDLVGMSEAQKAISMSYLLSVPGSLIGDPFISYIHSRHGWTVSIETIGAIAAVSAISAMVVRFLTNKRLFAIV